MLQSYYENLKKKCRIYIPNHEHFFLNSKVFELDLFFRVNFDLDPNPKAFGFRSGSERSGIRICLINRIRIQIRIRKKSFGSPTQGLIVRGKNLPFRVVFTFVTYLTLPGNWVSALRSSGTAYSTISKL